jgi:hypothetical protein
VKTRSPTLNCIGWFAPGQGYHHPPRFFEIAKRLRTTPDQEIQLPELETDFIIVLGNRTSALVKGRDPKLHRIGWFAHGQGCCVSRVLGSGFLMVFACLLLLIDTNPLQLPMEIKLETKSLAWERFAH